MKSTNVLIVGAGPTGLAIACGLALHGVAIRVIDKAAGPASTSRANFLHARGSEVLDRLDALGDLPDEALPGMSITTFLGDRPLMKLRFGDTGMKTAAPPMLISQARIEAALRERLAQLGAAPQWGNALVDLEQDEAGVTATLGNGERVRTDWLIGCDGTGSTTRRLAGIEFPGVKVSERFLLADLHLDWNLDRGGTTGWIAPDGMLGAMPMPDPDGRSDLWRLIAYDPGHEEHKPDDQQFLARFQEILPARTGDPTVRIRDAVWLSMFRVHRRLADTYRRGRVLIAGDAAHAHAPFGGQGMLTGLGDAENLAWKLALVIRGHATEPLLDTYQAERRPLATEVLRGTTAATRINIARSAIGRFLRDRIIVRLFNRPSVQRWATYTASQLWVSYRRGPLGSGTRLSRRPRPGDRIPDQECLTESGEPVRLHAQLGGHWALLVPPTGDAACVAAARRWLPENLVPLHRVGDTEDALLVRPDGHLAWRGHNPADLDRWLQAALERGRARR